MGAIFDCGLRIADWLYRFALSYFIRLIVSKKVIILKFLYRNLLILSSVKINFSTFSAFACPVKYRQIERSEFNRGGHINIE